MKETQPDSLVAVYLGLPDFQGNAGRNGLYLTQVCYVTNRGIEVWKTLIVGSCAIN